MKSEIIRKITSLTLLTILLASGVTFALPGAMPVAEASHNANLYVSAENPLFSNYFGGPMVVEIVINDPTLTDTDEGKGEPDVTVNGKDVRMIQATDGLWYAYIADRTQAQLADANTGAPIPGAAPAGHGVGLDFGTFCPAGTDISDADATGSIITFPATVGIAIPRSDVGFAGGAAVLAGSQGTAENPIATACVLGAAGANLTPDAGTAISNHVVREPKTPSNPVITGGSAELGQLGLISTSVWPFIQLYDFNPTGNAEIKYNKGGGTQTTTLTFDTMDTFSKLSLDRSSYPLGASVHVTITDGQLNIDPTDEDSWSFATNAAGTTNLQTRYQLFDENGAIDGDLAAGTSPNLNPVLTGMMFEDNGVVKLNGNVQGGVPIVDLDTNNDQALVGDVLAGGLAETTVALIPTVTVPAIAPQPMTFIETGSNTGIFTNYDEQDDSNLDVNNPAPRGIAASIDYNKKATSIITSLAFGTIDINAADAEWNSGEEIPVTLNDPDQNLNSRADEDLDLFNQGVTIIPSLRIGNPITLNRNPGLLAPTPVPFALVDAVTVPAATAGTVVSPITTPIGAIDVAGAAPVDLFSDIARPTWPAASARTLDAVSPTSVAPGAATTGSALVLDLGITLDQLQAQLIDDNSAVGLGSGYNFFNYDIRSIVNSLNTAAGVATGTISEVDIYLLVDTATPAGAAAGAFDETLVAAGAARFNAVYLGTRTGSALVQGTFAISQLDTFTPIDDLADAAIFTEGGAAPFAAQGGADQIGLMFVFDGTTGAPVLRATSISPIVADFFAFGINGDGLTEAQRINNAIYRFELEETGDNTSTFVGSAEYQMLNQDNILNRATYTNLRTIDDEITFIISDDSDDEDAPRINYLDVGGDGIATQISDQQDAPTHSGTVSFDKDNYKVADTVTVTLEDQDLNVDSDLIDIYTTVAVAGDPAFDMVGALIVDPCGPDGVCAVPPAAGSADDGTRSQVNRGPIAAGFGLLTDGTVFGRLLDITFDDLTWVSGTVTGICPAAVVPATFAGANGLGASGFTLVETGAGTGIFKGDFQVPTHYCVTAATGTAVAAAGTYGSTTGTDIEVNYVDFRDASGETIEIGDGGGVRANTGSVSLDRTVYPVPFGAFNDYCALTPCAVGILGAAPTTQSIVPIHNTAIIAVAPTNIDKATETLPEGDVIIHVRVNDPDFDVSATGEDLISQVDPLCGPDGITGTADDGTPCTLGPVLVTVSRGSAVLGLATAGESVAVPGGLTTVAPTLANGLVPFLTELGPIKEIAPNAGIFELDMNLKHTDGPLDTTGKCPTTTFYDVSVQNIATTAATATAAASSAGVAPSAGAIPSTINRGIEDRFLQSVIPGGSNYCILQGDILTVQYTDPTDASGDVNTVTDSASFDLRNGVLQSDKSVYIIGSDM
ncbi:MAG: hypothetical protein ACRD32_00270, partial [Nitrososphaerales archaeon]